MDGLSGWEQFFDELDSFIRSVNRQRGTANEDFSEYVVERLEMCTRSVSSLIHHLRLNAPTDEAAARIGIQYSTNLSELLECLRSMLREWQDYLNHYQLRSTTSYASRTQSVPSQLGGRPRFDISREQLPYLHSVFYMGTNI